MCHQRKDDISTGCIQIAHINCAEGSFSILRPGVFSKWNEAHCINGLLKVNYEDTDDAIPARSIYLGHGCSLSFNMTDKSDIGVPRCIPWLALIEIRGDCK